MDKKFLGTILLAAGIILAAVFAALDIVGLGREPGFGYIQIAGTVIGVIALIIGLIFTIKT